MKQFHYCKACHRSHDQQRQHLYTKKHITSVEALLAKARKKVKEVRQYVRSPALIKEAEQARNQLWCVFCDEDVVAEASTFACENPIRHLANPSHVEQVRLFLLANLLDRSRLDGFTISENDFSKWEKNSARLLAPGRPSPGSSHQPPHVSTAVAANLQHSVQQHVSSASAPRSADLAPSRSSQRPAPAQPPRVASSNGYAPGDTGGPLKDKKEGPQASQRFPMARVL